MFSVSLAISDENFADTLENAEGRAERLSYDEPWTLEQAAAEAGLDEEKYAELIRCVHTRLFDRAMVKPLYVQYDGSQRQMKALLFCIYAGVPYYMRKLLRIASDTGNGAERNHLIFSEKAAEKELYVFPQTGENNFLTERQKAMLDREVYIDFFARNFRSAGVSDYYFQMDSFVRSFGDAEGSDHILLGLAHRLLYVYGGEYERAENEDLKELLADALRADTKGNPNLERCIARLLAELNRRNGALFETSEKKLQERIAVSEEECFGAEGERYFRHSLLRMGEEEASDRLLGFSEQQLQGYVEELTGEEKGLRILDRYYAKRLLGEKEITWGKIELYEQIIRQRFTNSAAEEVLDACAEKLYKKGLGNEVKRHEAFARYKSYIEGKREEELVREQLGKAKRLYWETQTYEAYDYALGREYAEAAEDNERCRGFLQISTSIGHYRAKDEAGFWESVHGLIEEGQGTGKSIQEEKLGVLKREIEKRTIHKEALYLCRWIDVIAYVPKAIPIDAALCIKKALRERIDENILIKAYQSLWNALRQTTPEVKNNIAMRINDIAIDALLEAEEKTTVPLDIWLVIGEGQYDNCFKIFDDVAYVGVLKEKAQHVVRDSRFLREEKYLMKAEQYVREGGFEKRCVKNWCREVQKIKNTPKDDGRGGIFKGFRR